jgi:peptidoglycan/LPS O-acetylase OafA/YrhL
LERPHVFTTLDGLRGVAAVAVIQAHLGGCFNGYALPHVGLAVDFFFMLSGFVITYAYQEKLDAGWATWSFLRVRVIRLYPLYLLGMLSGTAYIAWQAGYGKIHVDVATTLYLTKCFILALFLLPAPPQLHAQGGVMFPLLIPAWSLFFEVVMNGLHGLLLRRRASRSVLAAMLICLAVWAGGSLHFGIIYVGMVTREMIFGLARAGCSYLLGCLLLRAWRSKRARLKAPPAVCAAALLCVLFLPYSSPQPVVLDFALVLLVFPAILWAGASATAGVRVTRVAAMLGSASYAVYMLHLPLGDLMGKVWMRALHHPMEADRPWSGLVLVGILFPLTLWLDRVYDMPVRGWLKRKLA